MPTRLRTCRPEAFQAAWRNIFCSVYDGVPPGERRFLFEKAPNFFFDRTYSRDRETMNLFVSFEPRHLPFGVMPDFSIELSYRLCSSEFSLQVPSEVAIFEPQFLHTFPRNPLSMKTFYFPYHTRFHSRE